MTPELFEVRMLGLPLLLRERSRQQGADLLREMALVLVGEEEGSTAHPVPRRLVELAGELDTVYGPYVEARDRELDDALERGDEVVEEVVYALPAGSVEMVRHVRDVLAEVDAYSRDDAWLLTLAPDEAVAAFREWSVDEVLRQHAGQPPTPWPAFAAARGLPA